MAKRKHPGGRPTDYSEEMLVKAREYIDYCQDIEIEDDLEIQGHGGALKRKNKSVVRLPTKGGLARHLGVSRDTLYEWSNVHEKFSDIMEELGAEQEDRLINNGLSGDYNPTIAKVLLTKHGYHEKQEIDHTTKGEKIEADTERLRALAESLLVLQSKHEERSQDDIGTASKN
mgnify:FL=1